MVREEAANHLDLALHSVVLAAVVLLLHHNLVAGCPHHHRVTARSGVGGGLGKWERCKSSQSKRRSGARS
jgi:hypothetical protein